MRDPKKRSLASACFWLNRCYDLGLTAEEVVARSAVNHKAVNAVNRKEKGKGKETFPPAPPIEKREGQEKAAAAAAARVGVRVRACAPAREESALGPTLDQVEKFAATIGVTSAFARAWFDQMDRINRWRHPKSNLPIVNWRRSLQVYWKRRGDFDPRPEAEPRSVPTFDYGALEDL